MLASPVSILSRSWAIVTPNERPMSVDQCERSRQRSSSRPTRRHSTRAEYGSANSATNSHRPRSAKASTSSAASSRNPGTIRSISAREKAGFASRRRRR